MFDACDRQDAAAAVSEFVPEGTFYEVPRDEEFTKTEFREFLDDTIFELYPDYRVEESRTLVTYEWATVTEWTFSGTHKGAVGETAPVETGYLYQSSRS